MKKKVDLGANGRREVRHGGVHLAWAIFVLEDRSELPCWIIDESSKGMGLETREQRFPCPITVGETYWIRMKPSAARAESWVAVNVKNIKEKTVGSGIYKVGVSMSSTPPAELGKGDAL